MGGVVPRGVHGMNSKKKNSHLISSNINLGQDTTHEPDPNIV